MKNEGQLGVKCFLREAGATLLSLSSLGIPVPPLPPCGQAAFAADVGEPQGQKAGPPGLG